MTVSPSAVIISSAATAVPRLPLPMPDPWVAVAMAPPTEMCGSDARLWIARPSSPRSSASLP
ncbi:hypothetical protein W824_00305 [Clavibacter cf. michiganensis LMG 26808]|nr:hypothetical protein W824_00305 [Clavibacter cf. michiganensis LMG 26808]